MTDHKNTDLSFDGDAEEDFDVVEHAFEWDNFDPWDPDYLPEEEEEEDEEDDDGLIQNVLTGLGLGAQGNGNAYGVGNGNGNSLFKLLLGGKGDDHISGSDKADLVLGGQGSDLVEGGDGDDTLMGDVDGETGADATPLVLNINNLVSQTYTGNNAAVGDYAIYRDVAFLSDGSSVWGRLVLVSASDPYMTVDLSGERGAEITIDGYGTGDTAQFRLEFFDPTTGEPISINSTATFNDLDQNYNAWDVEAVSLNADDFDAFGTASNTSLNVTNNGSTVRAAGSEANNPDDQDAWFSAQFAGQTSINFTLEARSTASGFTLSGDLIDDAVYVPLVEGNDTLLGGVGRDVIFGQGGNDWLDGGDDDDEVDGGDGDDHILGGRGNDILRGGAGRDVLSGGEGDDLIDGGEGDDYLSTGLGNDTLLGGEGNDTLHNSAGDDSLVGGVGNDSIVATAGNDTLEGDEGDDTLIGGTDNDVMDGGADNDLMLGDMAGVTFNGSGTDGVASASGLSDFPSSELTYEVTFASSADPSGQVILGSYTTAGDNDMLFRVMGNNLDLIIAGQSVPATGVDVSSFFDGEPHTFAFTWDSATGGVEFWVDGTSVHTTTVATGATIGQGGTFVLGQDQDALGGGFDTSQIFDGTIYGVRLYDDIRSPGELGTSMFGVYADTSDPNLVANWVADPNSASFTDQTGNHAMTTSGDTGSTWSTGNDSMTGGTGSDTIYGGGGNDTIDGGDGDDTLHGGDGDDLIYGGAGNDYMTTGTGNDTLYGGEGDDTLHNSSGDDSLVGGVGNDSIVATDGYDTLEGGEGNDTMYGGNDDDRLVGGTGDDLMYGESGRDTFIMEDNFGNDTIVGGEAGTDFDTIDFSAMTGPVTVTYTGDEAGYITDGTSTTYFSEIERLILTDQADVVDASADSAGVIIDAGAGNDTLQGGSGNDKFTGGDGDDEYVLTDSGGWDRITDFDIADDDSNGFYNDQLDVSELTGGSGSGGAVRTIDVTTSDDGFGNAMLTFPNGEVLVLEGITPNQMTTHAQLFAAGIPCFTPGTLVVTGRGAIPVEHIQVGDLLQTADNGLKPVIWIGRRLLSSADLMANPHLRPIQLQPGGMIHVERAMRVSPQHRFASKTPLPGQDSFLKAKLLAELDPGFVTKDQSLAPLCYIHLMTEEHQVIFADGCRTETFWPGPDALRSLGAAGRRELRDLFPELLVAADHFGPAGRAMVAHHYGALARPDLRRRDLREVLAERPAMGHLRA